jgi:hypothetical protein
VSPSRRSVPVINRFCPVIGWWTVLQLLVRRVSESIPVSVHDRNTLWSRTEDDLLVQVVSKYSTSDVLCRDWSEVESELSGHSEIQYKEHYLNDTVVELIFVFLRVTFRGSPSFRCSIVITKDTDSVDSTRPIHCNTSERRVGSATAPTPFIRLAPVISRVPCTSATCLLCISTSVDLPLASPSLCYSLTHRSCENDWRRIMATTLKLIQKKLCLIPLFME